MKEEIKQIIREIPKYINGSDVIPKDDIVVQYSALEQVIEKCSEFDTNFHCGVRIGAQEVISLLRRKMKGSLASIVDIKEAESEYLNSSLTKPQK